MHKPKLRLNTSNYLSVLLLLNHLGAISILSLLDLVQWLWQLSVAGCVVSLLLLLRYHAWRVSAQSVHELWPLTGGQWALRDRQGEIKIARLCAESVVTRCITVLNFKVKGQRRVVSVVICPDAVDSESFRRLRVWLFSGGSR